MTSPPGGLQQADIAEWPIITLIPQLQVIVCRFHLLQLCTENRLLAWIVRAMRTSSRMHHACKRNPSHSLGCCIDTRIMHVNKTHLPVPAALLIPGTARPDLP